MNKLTPEQIQKLGLENRVQVFWKGDILIDKKGASIDANFVYVGILKIQAIGKLVESGCYSYTNEPKYLRLESCDWDHSNHCPPNTTHYSLGNFETTTREDPKHNVYFVETLIPIAYFKQK